MRPTRAIPTFSRHFPFGTLATRYSERYRFLRWHLSPGGPTWREDLDFCTHATRSGSGLGYVKTGRREKLIEEISPRITIGAMTISERGRL